MSGNKSDRSRSPAAMSEEGRRELLARQHRALYGNDSPAFFPPTSSFSGDDAHSARGENTTSGTPASTNNAVRGPSPRGTDPFAPSEPLVPGATANSSAAGTTAAAGSGAGGGRQSPSRANSTSSPNAGTMPSYGLYDSTAEQPVTSTSSPGGKDSPSRTLSSGPIGSVGPIGSRPSQPATSQASNSGLGKPFCIPSRQHATGLIKAMQDRPVTSDRPLRHPTRRITRRVTIPLALAGATAAACGAPRTLVFRRPFGVDFFSLFPVLLTF